MKRIAILILLASFHLGAQTSATSATPATSAAPAAAAPAAAAGQTLFEYGFEQRVRNEDWNNLMDYNQNLNDKRAQVRYRSRLWMKAALNKDIDFSVGLNQETNEIIKPDKPFRFDEVIFETAYIDFKKLFVKGLSLRVGRQNIMKNEGFLIFEGNPGDGSRTTYFNAAVLAYSWKKSKLEFIGIDDPRTDRFLPRFHPPTRTLNDWSEQALGTYYTDGNLKNTSIEAYYFYKKEVRDQRAATHPLFQPDRHVSTVGGRVVQKFKKGWSATGEFGLQWGAQHPSTQISGRGGYAYVKKTFGAAAKNYVLAGYIGMSGDNPATTGKYEGWDPIFSRWPKYSELYIYSQVNEKAVAYWTNTGMWQMEAVYFPFKPVQCRFTLYHMDAFYPFKGNPATFGTGTARGNLPQVRVDYTRNARWKGHILYERLVPGSYYSVQSPSHFLRFEVTYTLTGIVKKA
jgi:hypothetical protein